MNTTVESLPGSRIQCEVVNGKLELRLPSRPRRAMLRATVLLFAVAGVVLVLVYQDLPLLGATCAGVFVSVLFFFVFAFFVGPQLTKTFVTFTPDRLVVKTIDYGREDVEQFDLSGDSCARKHWAKTRHGSAAPPGIELSDTAQGQAHYAHFGDLLSRGEMDWIIWRINWFLGKATEADAPSAQVPGEPIPRPDSIMVRIEEDAIETRIDFPNTVATGSYSGIGVVIFCLGWYGYWLYCALAVALPQPWHERSPGIWLAFSVAVPLMLLLGLPFLLSGLTRLFGRRRLTISPGKITFRDTVLGIGTRYSLPAADVISLGVRREIRSPSGRIIVPAANEHVIRTACREMDYGEQFRDAVRNQAEADWLAGEIDRRIYAARYGELPPTRNHNEVLTPKPEGEFPKPPPAGPVPYNIDQRPMPSGEDLEVLLPARVGPFHRASMDEHRGDVRNKLIDVQYRSSDQGFFSGSILVTTGVYDDLDGAQEAIDVVQAEVSELELRPDDELSLNTEPNFFKTITRHGVFFMAWTRGNYYFSAEVPGEHGEHILTRFMESYPF